MTPEGASRRRLGSALALGALVLLAVLLRAHNLGSPPLWVDEAESAINALTIVANGVPGDRLLGQPLYENTLVRPWPESPEYEFRDISYSDKGLAVYHGWLPLYAIAGAFRLAGVTPELARRGTPPRNAGLAEFYRWTAVPRWPALLFSAMFVVAAYGLGRAVQGVPVAWAMAFAAATANFFVWFGRQARYYSALLAGDAACGLAVWNAWRRGRLSDHAVAGIAIGVLFHTHSLSAVAMAGVYVAAIPLGRRQPQLWLRVFTAGTVAGLLVLPWAAWSGLLGHTAYIPAARHYLDLPLLLHTLPSKNPAVLATAGFGLVWLATALLRGEQLPLRWRQPILDERLSIYFAVIWLVLSYSVFVALVPAASYAAERLQLMVAVPGLLLLSLVITAAAGAIRPASRVLPVAGVAALLAFAGHLTPRLVPEGPDPALRDLVRTLRSWSLGSDGRIFATPNDHLTLTYYSGRPIQSIAPVRKEWLDRFTGDLVVMEFPWLEVLTPAQVQEEAWLLGRTLGTAEAKFLAEHARRAAIALDLVASGAQVDSPVPKLDDLGLALVAATKARTRQEIGRVVRNMPLPPVVSLSNWKELHGAFFHWFVDPERRVGPDLNYSRCRHSAIVHVHPSGYVVYDCRTLREAALVQASW